LADVEGLGTLEGGVPVEVRMRGRRVQAAAQAFAISQLITEALTAIVRDHRPCGRRAHIHVGAGGTPDPGDVAAEIARGQILVRVQLPGEGPRS
jgi:hypothetical protein